MLIRSSDEMQKFGESLSKKYNKFLLFGELGAGKTHFVKGVALGLGLDPEIVQSPTYTYMNIYDNKFLHIDLYRMEDEKDFIEKGILDQIEKFDYIAIEWPKFEKLYADTTWVKLEIQKIDENTREINV